MSTLLIIGASSGIGRAIAEFSASQGSDQILCAPQKRDLKAVSANLEIQFHVKARICPVDITHPEALDSFFDFCDENNDFDTVIITVGQVLDHDNGLISNHEIESLVKTNYLSIIQLISYFVKNFQKRNRGCIVIFSSIAAARARKNNVIYGSAKAALEFYCQGLQHLLMDTDIKIQLYRMGYADTSMSFGKQLLLPVADPQKIARKVVQQLTRNVRIQYIPRFWTIIIYILKKLPWSIYKKISF